MSVTFYTTNHFWHHYRNLRGAELENVLRRYMPDAPRAANE